MSYEDFAKWIESDEFKQQVAREEEEKYRCKLERPSEWPTSPDMSDFNPAPTSWGPWSFNREYLTLENGGYDVDLERINCSADLADWIFQIHGKNHHAYGGCQQVNDFIQALKTIFGREQVRQSTWNGTALAKAYIKKAYPRREVSPKLRHQILERDGFRCCDCGESSQTPGVVLEVDHKIAVSKGGSNDPDNLRTLCKDCNIGKSNRDIDYPEGHK